MLAKRLLDNSELTENVSETSAGKDTSTDQNMLSKRLFKRWRNNRKSCGCEKSGALRETTEEKATEENSTGKSYLHEPSV